MPSLADQLYAIAQMDAREQADQYVVGEGVRVIFLGFSLDCQPPNRSMRLTRAGLQAEI